MYSIYLNATCLGYIEMPIFMKTRTNMVGDEELRGWSSGVGSGIIGH